MYKAVIILLLSGLLVACGTAQIREDQATPAADTPKALMVWVDEAVPLDQFWPEAAFSVNFSQSMDPKSAEPALLSVPEVEGELAWNEDGTQLTFTPATVFDANQSYLMVLNKNLRTAQGAFLNQALKWEITVLAKKPASTLPPRVTRREPSQKLLGERLPTLKLTFSREMDVESIPAAFQVEPAVPVNLSWEGTQLTIRFREPLTPGQTYRFTLNKLAAASDEVGMEDTYTWVHELRPTLASASWPTLTDRDSKIVLHFNYPVDRASLEESVRVEPAIKGNWHWEKQSRRATLIAGEPLPVDTQYTVSFSGPLFDPEGNALPAPPTLTFTTPPPILSMSPAAGETANPATVIRIRFDRPMDQEKTAAAFSLDPETAGETTWQDDNTLIFTPAAGYLNESSAYRANLDNGVADAAGNALLRNGYSWTFRTGAYTPAGSFSDYGANAQVLSTDGRRAIQFLLLGTGTQPVEFELYRLDVEQFLDRYASGFRGVEGWEKRPIPTEGTQLVKSWQETFSRSGTNNVQEVIIPEDIQPGLYILNLRGRQVDDQLILLLSGNTIVVKQAEGQLLAWVTETNGGALPGVEVSVYARNGELLSRGLTDGNGVYRTILSRDPQPLIVVARQGADLTASGLSNEWRSPSGMWGWWWEAAPEARDYAVYVYTERPIYRPGQEVHFKAVVRNDADARLGLPEVGLPVTARIRDARNNIVQTFELSANRYGTANGTFQIAEGAMLGDYAVEIALGDNTFRQTFKVQDYRKPDIEVSVKADAEGYVAGDPIKIQVDSSYFFGEPAANARVTVRYYTLGEPYYWYEPEQENTIWYKSEKAEHSGRTDENGQYTFTLPAEMSNTYDDYESWYYRGSSLRQTTWGIEATVDDGSNQTVSGFAVVKVLNAAESISLESDGYFKTPGQSFEIQVQARDVLDRPVAERDLTLYLRRWDSKTYDYSETVRTASRTTDEHGEASLTLSIEQAGDYQLSVWGQDSQGNKLWYTTGLYVFKDAAWWSSSRETGLLISADEDSYSPGDTAQVKIASPFSGPALLSFERGSTRDERLIHLTAPLTLIDVPIEPEYSPNIHLSVSAWEQQDTQLTGETYTNLPDSLLHTAHLNLKVPVTGKELTVSIIPDQETYAPREEASFTLRVTDDQGNPVEAEVSLAMVDEAIFSLSEELSGPIFETFYAERPNIVQTYDAMALRRYLYGYGGQGGGGGGETGANPRREFPDTAAWFPALHTDANGEVVVRLTMPDSLTSWRLTAKATTGASTQVGEAKTNVITQQAIVVRPILPRSLTAGDQVMLSAMVANYSEEAGVFNVSIQASGLEIHGTITQTLELGPGERAITGWRASAREAGEAEVTIRSEGDAVRLSIPVRPLAVPDVESLNGDFTGEFSTTLAWPEEALELSSVKVELNRSIAGSLLTGLEHLTGFPYGCVEQTMSKALPNAVIGRALHQLGMSNPTLQAELPAQINAGLQKLYGFQHNDGGWGWWFDDASDAYQTAWVVFGLAVTREAGYEVDAEVIQRGVNWLAERLEQLDVRVRAYALYSMAMAGHGDLAATQTLLEQIESLDTFGRAALALALNELGEVQEAGQIVDGLAETAIQRDEKAYWEGRSEDGEYDRKTMASSTRTTALVLSAFVHIRPGHSLEPRIVRWLMGERQASGWGSTNETAHAILALTDHLLANKFATAEAQYQVELNGQVIGSGRLGPGQPAAMVEIPADQMRRGDNTLRIGQGGAGRLYYVISQRVYLGQAEIPAAGKIKVMRNYLDAKSSKPVDKFTPGQLVKVTLEVDMPENGSYLIIEDNLPGGLEALNEGLNTTSHEGSSAEEPAYYWEDYGYNYKEVHSDRVSFFSTEVSKGGYTYTYYARAVYPGSFAAMPAEVWAMYDANLWGRSASNVVEVFADE